MKTLRDALLNTSVEPAGQGWPLQIFGDPVSRTPGPFLLTEDYDVIDTNTQTRYVRDRTVPLNVATISVPGLTSGPTNIAYLFAIAVKPLWQISDSDVQTQGNIMPKFLNDGLNKDKFEASDVFWLSPDDGHEITPNVRYVAGFPGYYLDGGDGDKIKDFETNSEVVSGTNRGRTVVLKDLNGDFVEVDKAHFVRLAYGKATEEDFDAPIYFVDNNQGNLDPANMTTEAPVVTGITGTATNPANDYIIGNE